MSRTIVDIPESDLEELDGYCRRRGVSRAEAVRRAVTGLLNTEARQEVQGFGLWASVQAGSGVAAELARTALAAKKTPSTSSAGHSVVIDTDVLLAYLRGQVEAKSAFERHAHRCISVVSWLEAMRQAPAEALDETRAFLRTLERLSLSEAIADEALHIMREDEHLQLKEAVVAATAVSCHLPILCERVPISPAYGRIEVFTYRAKRPVRKPGKKERSEKGT